MIKNVNLMQNPHDIAWDRFSEEYVIQALANLGQRIGIKGDGISYKSFTFNDILTSNIDFDPNTYIGYIEYIKNNKIEIPGYETSKYKANFGITKKLNLSDIINIDTTLSINDILYFPTELTFTVPINTIEKYSKNSICSNINNELTYILAGKIIGYEDYDEYNTALLYEKFDIITNKLKCAYKLFHFSNDYPNDFYCLIETKNDEYGVSNKLSNKYTMTIYLFNINNIEDRTQSQNLSKCFKDIFTFTKYYDVDQLPFNLLNAEYVDINRLESYRDETTLYYESNSPISIIKNNIKNINKYVPQSINLIYDSESNQFLAQDQNQYESVIDLFNNEYQLNLDEEIFMLNNDISTLYFNILNYYNEKFYLENRPAFIKRILSKVYEKVANYDYKNSCRLYIPLDFEFHYICNSNNEMEIYYSNNIYVTSTSLNIPYIDEFWENNINLIYDYKGVDKIKAYNFEINYNKADTSIINSVSIKDIFTMPYINANENWSINEIDTKIKAVGRDAGNPNIIIIFNHNQDNLDDSYEILNAISYKKYVIGSEYELRWFTVNNALFENSNVSTIKCCAYIPKITERNFDYFKNSVILSISDLNCLEDIDNCKYKYKGSYILTMWHLISDDDNNYSFEYIRQSNTDYSLALGSTVNLLNETDDESVGNLNAQDLVLLKSILSTVGQERLAINNNNWLILKNKQSEEYYASSDKVNVYNNDLNAIIQYNDDIKLVSDHIIHKQNNKYVNSTTNLEITNSLYPKYETNTIITTGQEIVQKLKKVDTNTVSKKIRESRITVKGQLITNIETLLEELEHGIITVEELKEVKIEQSQKVNSNYNEYIFNSNIPSIDYQEIFNRNVNVLNRVNIVSIDNNGSLYNAYIGTSYDEAAKSTLHIGTTSTNINIGTDTLFNEIDKSKFNKHDTLSLDFNNIILNAKDKILTKQEILHTYNYNGKSYNFSNIILIGMCMSGEMPISENSGNRVNFSLTDWNNRSSDIFAKKSTLINGNISETFYISINNVFKKYFNFDLTNYINHIYIDNNYKEGDLITITRESMNDKVYLYKLPSDIPVYNNLPDNVIYIPMMLNIMYYINSETVGDSEANTIHIYVSFNK